MGLFFFVRRGRQNEARGCVGWTEPPEPSVWRISGSCDFSRVSLANKILKYQYKSTNNRIQLRKILLINYAVACIDFLLLACIFIYYQS